MHNIYGVDPGQKGAIVCMEPKSKFPALWWPMSEWKDAVSHARVNGDSHFIIEAAQPMPGQGGVSIFSYGMGYGKIIGYLEAYEIPYQTVHPRVWTKVMFQGIPTGLEKKERNREAFKRLYPAMHEKILKEPKAIQSGVIDAVLIARWGCLNLL